MLELSFMRPKNDRYIILCLGAHSDDIEIGCGGSILSLVQRFGSSEIFWIILSSNKIRAAEARKSAELFLSGAKERNIIIKDFKNSFFPYIGADIKVYFESLKGKLSPDLIFTHYRNDLHQDHRLVSELTWNTFRDHLILEYEIPKYDGDVGSPNFFVPIDKSIAERKFKFLFDSFESQKSNHWFNRETLISLLRLRGIESNAKTGLSEAFYCRKMVYNSSDYNNGDD